MDKQNNSKNNNMPLPFIAPGSDIPITQEEIEKRKRRIERALEIGQDLTNVTEDEYENPYRVQALLHILKDEEVPETLKQKIYEFDMETYSKLAESPETSEEVLAKLRQLLKTD